MSSAKTDTSSGAGSSQGPASNRLTSTKPLLWREEDFIVSTGATEWELENLEKTTRADLEKLQEAAQKVLQACTAARAAQKVLRSQVSNIGLLVAAAGGEPHSEAHVATAMKQVEAAFSDHVRWLQAAHAAHTSFITDHRTASGMPWPRHLQLQRSAVTALHRLWNQAESPLLHLPDTALHLIARGTAPTIRLVCCRMADVYGSPGSTLDLRSSRMAGAGASQVNALHQITGIVSNWKWPEAVQELCVRLPSRMATDPCIRQTIASALPQLRRLHWESALETGSQPDAQPPSWASLTALTWVLLCKKPTVMPYAMPHLRSLHFQFGHFEFDHHPLGARTQLVDILTHLHPLTGLTHLRVSSRGALFVPAGAQEALGSVLIARAASLVSLQLSIPSLLGHHLSCLTSLHQLHTLVFDDAVDGDTAGMPSLQQLPSLRHLHLNAVHGGFAELQALLQAGSPWLLSLNLPDLTRVSSLETGASRWLHGTWPGFSALTSLRLRGVLYRNTKARYDEDEEEPYLPDAEAGLPWLSGVARLPGLQHLAIEMWVDALSRLEHLQPLISLTHLQLTLHRSCWHTRAHAPCGRPTATLGRLTQLRGLTLGSPDWSQSDLLPTVQHAAKLPHLAMLDMKGLGALGADNGELLQPLLAPGCAVRKLNVRVRPLRAAATSGHGLQATASRSLSAGLPPLLPPQQCASSAAVVQPAASVQEVLAQLRRKMEVHVAEEE